MTGIIDKPVLLREAVFTVGDKPTADAGLIEAAARRVGEKPTVRQTELMLRVLDHGCGAAWEQIVHTALADIARPARASDRRVSPGVGLSWRHFTVSLWGADAAEDGRQLCDMHYRAAGLAAFQLFSLVVPSKRRSLQPEMRRILTEAMRSIFSETVTVSALKENVVPNWEMLFERIRLTAAEEGRAILGVTADRPDGRTFAERCINPIEDAFLRTVPPEVARVLMQRHGTFESRFSAFRESEYFVHMAALPLWALMRTVREHRSLKSPDELVTYLAAMSREEAEAEMARMIRRTYPSVTAARRSLARLIADEAVMSGRPRQIAVGLEPRSVYW